MRDPTEVFAELSKSKFRSGCHLNEKDRAYFVRRGMEVVLEHAADFIETRLAPAAPAKDGRQTPWRGHPVFVAQHATATCCRGCLQKWHRIPKGRAMSAEEQAYAVDIIRRWLSAEIQSPPPPAKSRPGKMRELFDYDKMQAMADDRSGAIRRGKSEHHTAACRVEHAGGVRPSER